jgi:hypothetical protein
MNASVTLPADTVVPTKGGPKRLPFRTIGDALRATPEQPDWLVEGLIARTMLTTLGGRPKTGKSTLVFWMLSLLAQGLPFLGCKTTKARALLLTEERQATLQEKRRLFGLGDDDLHILMRHESVGAPWLPTVRQASEYCREHELALLVIDSWDKWIVQRSGGESENSASDTLANVGPLMDVAGDGLAVLTVAHQGKQRMRYGEALRGSNAFAGAQDVIAELERSEDENAKPGDRVLHCVSRLSSTPETLTYTWNQPTGWDG